MYTCNEVFALTGAMNLLQRFVKNHSYDYIVGLMPRDAPTVRGLRYVRIEDECEVDRYVREIAESCKALVELELLEVVGEEVPQHFHPRTGGVMMRLVEDVPTYGGLSISLRLGTGQDLFMEHRQELLPGEMVIVPPRVIHSLSKSRGNKGRIFLLSAQTPPMTDDDTVLV